MQLLNALITQNNASRAYQIFHSLTWLRAPRDLEASRPLGVEVRAKAALLLLILPKYKNHVTSSSEIALDVAETRGDEDNNFGPARFACFASLPIVIDIDFEIGDRCCQLVVQIENLNLKLREWSPKIFKIGLYIA